jgi:hypothetical protein
MKTAVIIPALNESGTVARVVSEAIEVIGHHVFVVDDASSDDTAATARAAGATVLCMPYGSGAWNSIQAGIMFCMQRGYQRFVTMDADGQHMAQSIRVISDCAEATRANVVLGSYPERGSRGRRLVWRMFNRISGLGLRDMTTGLKCYDRDAAGYLLSSETALLDYQDVGTLLVLRRRGMSIREVPVVMCMREDGCSRVFSSWLAVFEYMLKSMLWILSDKIMSGTDNDHSWETYHDV